MEFFKRFSVIVILKFKTVAKKMQYNSQATENPILDPIADMDTN